MKSCIPLAIGLLVVTGLADRSAYGDFVVTLSGKPGTSLVHWTVSGGGTFKLGPAGLGSISIVDDTNTDFFGPELDASLPFLAGGNGTITNTTTNEVVSINRFAFNDGDPTPDNLQLQMSPPPRINPGDAFTMAGSGTIDLSTQGLSFDHMNTGIGVDSSNSVYTGSGTLIIRAVPEPSAFILTAFGLLSAGMIGRRRRS